ncbi:hypothetical protein B0T22DRAFT_248784 [Podospora appendiculata]|uniref:Uncharacterized protein n=1 Tax=Podospora appendiculata TaxID=314037 RepID=A0AAE0X2F7_9PEZI|nr:hypothetical protein B0T22DRAFT_248784 [Podospora appendiculata]
MAGAATASAAAIITYAAAYDRYYMLWATVFENARYLSQGAGRRMDEILHSVVVVVGVVLACSLGGWDGWIGFILFFVDIMEWLFFFL